MHGMEGKIENEQVLPMHAMYPDTVYMDNGREDQKQAISIESDCGSI